MKNNRISWIDIAKGIGIILVLLGHTPLPQKIINLIYIFHMPLFFFISGYLFSENISTLKELIRKRIKTLVIPYFLFSFINYIYYFFINNILLNKSYNSLKPFCGIFIAERKGGWDDTNGVLWFLPCLFLTEIAYYIIKKNIKSQKNRMGVIIIMVIVGGLYYKFINIPLPWSFDLIFVSIFFYSIGNYFRINDFISKFIISKKMFIFSFIILSFGTIIGLFNGYVSMYGTLFGKYYFYFIPALSGVLIVILISMVIDKKESILKYIKHFFIFMGQNTLIYLGLHYVILYPMIKYMLFNLGIDIVYCSKLSLIIIGGIYVIVTIIILIPIVFVINSYTPWMVGKFKRNKKMQYLEFKLTRN